MATVTVRPDGIYQIDAAWNSIGGAPSVQAALSDNSDVTYLQSTSAVGPIFIVDMGTVAAPPLAQYRSVTLRIRANAVSGPYIADAMTVEAGGVRGTYDQITWNTTIATFTGAARSLAPSGAPWAQDLIDAMRLVVRKALNIITQNVYEVYADVVYNEAPVTTVSAPTGTITTTSQPTVTWSVSDPEGDAQERLRIKVYSAAVYGAAGFDPETSTPIWDSGEIISAGTSLAIGTPLPNNTTYRAYVKVADANSGGRYGNWAFSGFSIAVDSPVAPDLVATADPALARVLLAATGKDNLLTTNQSNVETGTLGFAAVTNAGTLTRDTAQFRQGISSLRFQSLASGDMKIGTLTGLNGVPAVAGQTYTGMVSLRPASARSVRAELAFYDAAGAQIGSNTNGTSAAPGAGTWSDRTVSATAPANTAYASVIGTVLATGGAAEQAWADQFAVVPGTASAWSRGGFLTDLGRLSDSFDRADSTTSLGAADVGGAWTAQSGTWGINGSKGYLVSATADASAVLTSNALSDGYMQADITLSATANRAWAGLIFRAADNNNYLIVYLSKTATTDLVALQKRSGGTFTALTSVGSIGLVNGSTYTLKVEFFAGTIRVFINGVVKITYVLSAADLAAFGNNAKYGLYVNNGASADDGGSRFNNLSAGNPKSQTIAIERSIDGGNTWVGVRGANLAAPITTSAVQAVSVYDYELIRATNALYRAYAGATIAGQTLTSPASGNQSVNLASTGWWLKDPQVPARNMQLDVSRFSFRRKKPQQVHEPFGMAASLVVHDGVRGIEGALEVYSKSAARYTKLEAIASSGNTLFLEDILGRAWYVQLGEALEWSLGRAAPDVGETTPIRHFHTASWPFTEVASPSGQTVAAGSPTP